MIDSIYTLAAIGAAPPAAQPGGGYGFFVMIGLMFFIMYILIIRPQQKKQKEHQEMIGALRKGDKVVTNGGLYGRVTGLSDNTLTIEIADKVRVKIARSHVSGMAQAGGVKKS